MTKMAIAKKGVFVGRIKGTLVKTGFNPVGGQTIHFPTLLAILCSPVR